MNDISVITLTYNSEKYLNQCLDSIFLAFKELDSSISFEHIVCDGGSKDKTLEIVTSHPLKSVVLKSPVCGLYQSLDYAVKMANGKYLAYVHSDDFVSKFYFKSLIETILKNTQKNLSDSQQLVYPCSDIAFVDSESKVLWYRSQPKIIAQLQKKMNLVLHPNCLFDRSLELMFPYSQNNLNDADLDWKHINTLIENNVKFKRVANSYYFFRIHPKSTTVKEIQSSKTNTSARKLSLHHLKQISIVKLMARIYLYCHETQKFKRILQRIFLGKSSWSA